MAEDSKSTQDDRASGNRLRSLLIGWVLIPTLVIAALFAAGVHVGARHPDMLLTRGVLWLGGGEVEGPPQVASEPAKPEAEQPPQAQVAPEPAKAEAEQPPQAQAANEAAEPQRLPSTASQPPQRIELAFGWPSPAQAIVEQTIEKPGNNAKLRYRIEFERQGEDLLVHHRAPQLLELEGRPIDSDSKEAEIEGHLLLAGFIPSIVVGPGGNFVRVIDMDGYIEGTREALAASPEEHDAIALIMSSPKAKWMLNRRIGDIWRGWVELWVELDIMSDHEIRIESQEDLGEYRVVGFDEQSVELEFRLDHKLSKSELQDMLGAIARQEENDLPGLEGVTGGKDMVATVTLRRDTMLPLRSSNQLDTWVEFPGEPRRTRREVTRYTFEWQ